jgi:hypothetical protein
MNGSKHVTRIYHQFNGHAGIRVKELVRNMAEDTRRRRQLAGGNSNNSDRPMLLRLSGTNSCREEGMQTPHPRKARRALPRHRAMGIHTIVALILCWLVTPAVCVLIDFDNCLSDSYQNSNPRALQFVPLFLDVSFDAKTTDHQLQLTIWGNVSGAVTEDALPAPDSPDWSNPQKTLGKIQKQTSPTSKVTALSRKINVLTFQTWKEVQPFCDQLTNGSCPLGPTFSGNAYVNGSNVSLSSWQICLLHP